MVSLKTPILNAIRLPLPKERLKSVKEIDVDRLAKLGIDTILIDFDNTIVPWRHKLLDDSVRDAIRGWMEKGFKVAVVTNAGRRRVENVDLGLEGAVPVFHSLFKPSVSRLRQVLRVIGAKPESTAMVGDLFFTDIIAGNRLGMYTILVNPYLVGVTNLFYRTLAFLSKVFFYAFYYTIGWFFHIVDLTTPNESVDNVHQIDFETLMRVGFDTFVFDYDNTLSRWRTPPPLETSKLLKSLVSKGVVVIIASNGSARRMRDFKRYFGDGIIAMGSALKPSKGRVGRLLKSLGRDPKRTVVIGDQLFTDVLMGSRLGAYTIKVEPLDRDHESVPTKFLRVLERIIAPLQRGKPAVRREENAKV